MKKIFKTIPLLSSALVLTTPVITMTSCNKNDYEEFAYKFTNEHKPADFLPEGKSSLTKATEIEALNDLYNAYSQNKKYLADQLVYQFINNSVVVPHLTFTGSINAYIGNVDVHNHTISFKLKVDIVDDEKNKYQCELSATNIKFLVKNHDTWRFVPWKEYMNLEGIDANLQTLIIAGNRYHWQVSCDMNENSSLLFLKRAYPRLQIPYIGPMNLTINSDDYKDDYLYAYIYGVEVYILGSTNMETYYLRDVQFVEE